MTMNPILAVIFLSVMLMPLSTAIAKHPCRDGMYWSRRYGAMCRPALYSQMAICRDGTSSVFAYVQGACRGHGGVDHVQKKNP
jgi:hypothetical protein